MKTLTDLIGRPVTMSKLLGWTWYNKPTSSKLEKAIVIFIYLEVIPTRYGTTNITAKLYTTIGKTFYIKSNCISNFNFKNIYTAGVYCKSLNLPYTINYG